MHSSKVSLCYRWASPWCSVHYICECLHTYMISMCFNNPLSPPQPPNDPHGITKDELIEALRAVLSGTPKFAEVGPFMFCFWCKRWSCEPVFIICLSPLQFLLPLIIEKLDSDVQSAKLDSLQTLVRFLSPEHHRTRSTFPISCSTPYFADCQCVEIWT